MTSKSMMNLFSHDASTVLRALIYMSERGGYWEGDLDKGYCISLKDDDGEDGDVDEAVAAITFDRFDISYFINELRELLEVL